mgnify:CR=1 FL=1
MQEVYNNITPANNDTTVQTDALTIIQTDVGAKDGQNKCPKCGATIQPHRACMACGFYKGKDVLNKETTEETTK